VDHESTEDRPDGEVLAVYRRGYRLGDRLLRPAMVKVARGE
jgi:molecular chaperone GrpE (heat shock protein)